MDRSILNALAMGGASRASLLGALAAGSPPTAGRSDGATLNLPPLNRRLFRVGDWRAKRPYKGSAQARRATARGGNHAKHG